MPNLRKDRIFQAKQRQSCYFAKTLGVKHVVASWIKWIFTILMGIDTIIASGIVKPYVQIAMLKGLEKPGEGFETIMGLNSFGRTKDQQIIKIF